MTADEQEARRPFLATTAPINSALWSSTTWASFAKATGMKEAVNERVKCASTLELGLPDEPWERPSQDGQLVWTTEFQRALVRGVNRKWAKVALYRMMGPLSEMTKEELAKWTQHVRQGHKPYHKRCQTCVATRATGHAHRRVEAPSCFTLSVDVCGPFRVKGHTPDALDCKYMLVGSYTMPVLREGVCEPRDLIVNDSGAGVGDVQPASPAGLLDGEVESAEVPGLSGPRDGEVESPGSPRSLWSS